MEQLNIQPGDVAKFQTINPPKGTVIKLKPLHPAFYQIDNHTQQTGH